MHTSIPQDLLEKLRILNPNDIRAFPLLNESQRLIQRLREGITSLPTGDREAWTL